MAKEEKMRIIRDLSILFGLLVALTLTVAAQEAQNQLKREEILRYMGYEDMPSRYVSAPYDAHMSHNVEGNYMDIGFMTLFLVPLILILVARGRRNKIISLIFSLIVIIWSISSSPLIGNHGERVFVGTGDYENLLTGSGISSPWIVQKVYELTNSAFSALHVAFAKMTTSGDFISYPLMTMIMALLGYVLFFGRKFNGSNKQLVLLFMLCYAFFMWLLSAGIIWYAFLLFPLLYITIGHYIQHHAVLRTAGWLAFVVSICAFFTLKLSNINFLSDQHNYILEQPVVQYQLKNIDGNELTNAYFPNLTKGLDEINANEDLLVYKAGSPLTFFIKSNHKRVFADNLLGLFDRLFDEFKTKYNISAALKSEGVGYLVIGLNLANVDRTPEQSLAKKYQKLMAYLNNNVTIELIATDRVVADNKDGRQIMREGVFGQKIMRPGSYAIYKLK